MVPVEPFGPLGKDALVQPSGLWRQGGVRYHLCHGIGNLSEIVSAH